MNETIEALEPVSMAQIAQKFERFLETYRRPDAALADVFGVSPSWFLERKEIPMLFNEEANEEADGIAQYRARSLVLQRRNLLPERERKLVVGIVRHFTDQRGVSDWR